MRTRTWMICSLAVVAVTGCKPPAKPKAKPNPDGGTAAPPRLTLTVQPQIVLWQGTTAQLQYGLKVDRPLTRPTTVQVTGADAGLTVTAQPVDLAGAGLITLTAAVDEAVGERKLQVTVSAEGGSATAPVAVEVTANTGVGGRVVDQAGAPVARAIVRTATAITQTDDHGQFQVTLVTPPYDVDLVTADGRHGYRFVGIERRDPTFVLAGVQPLQAGWGVEGQLAGVYVPPPADAVLQLALAGRGVDGTGRPLTLDGNGFGPVSFPCSQQPELGSLDVLEARLDPTGALLGYYAGGELPVNVVAGGLKADAVVRLSLLRDGSVSGSVQPPAGFTLVGRRAQLVGADGAVFPVDDETSPSPSFLIPTPEEAGYTLRLELLATKGQQSSLLQKGSLPSSLTPVTLPMTAPPTITTPPAPGQALAPDTAFAWSDDASRVYAAVWGGSDPNDSVLVVVTAAKQATMPDLTALGFLPPTSPPLTFGVIGETAATMDAAASPDGLRYELLVPSAHDSVSWEGALGTDQTTFQLSPG